VEDSSHIVATLREVALDIFVDNKGVIDATADRVGELDWYSRDGSAE